MNLKFKNIKYDVLAKVQKWKWNFLDKFCLTIEKNVKFDKKVNFGQSAI